MAKTLSTEEARAFYDRFGAKQDKQAFYEDCATNLLIANGKFAEATAVLEFGCGTGRFAARLLSDHLSPACTYLGLDSSTTMQQLASERLRPWENRAEARLSDGSTRLEVTDASVDRIVSNYVLDLLSVEAIDAFLNEAHRTLQPDGRLCLTGLTFGAHLSSRLLIAGWRTVHWMRPALVGGCRPLELRDHLDRDSWRIEFREVVTAYGIPSEVVVAQRLSKSQPA